MAERCRAFDWAATPLGPVESWSQSLRTTVSTLLNCKNPMFLFWGPELVQFYNDGYRPSLGSGDRHPGALGARGRDFWPDIWPVIGPEIEQVMTTGVSTWHEDAYIPIERDGGMADVWWTYGYSPVFDDDGSIGGTLVVCQETTANVLFEKERDQFVHALQAERASLRNAEAQLRDQFARMPVATLLWEQEEDDFVLVATNIAAECISPGVGEKVGSRRQEIFPGSEDVAEDYRRCLRDDVIIHRSSERTGPPGHKRYLELSIGPQQPNRVLVHVTDVTEKTAFEMRLRTSQRMESVGLLAGGIAHDFNNLLTVIQAHSRFLLEEMGDTAPGRADIAAIGEATDRAAALTRELLAFSRKQILRPVHINANVVLEEISGMLRRVLGSSVEVKTSFTDHETTILIDPAQLEQIIMNLALNARDAMADGGGILTLRTYRGNGTSEPIKTNGTTCPADYFIIEVEDTGIGMDEAVRLRAFEPFFTTKDETKGQGMGLATVHGIVQQSGGHVELESVPGEGTRARLCFPGGTVEPVSPSGTRGGQPLNEESILLIEDEPGVRAIARRILTSTGYTVIEAPSGIEGLAISDDLSIPLHMVLTDAVMPGVGGAEVVQRIRARRPGIRAAIMSGHTNDDVIQRGIHNATVAFLQKPFTPAELTRFVREVLDAEAPDAVGSKSSAAAIATV